MTLPDYLLLTVLAVAVQAAVNHKYLGHVIVIGWYVFTGFMGPLGFEHVLWRFGSDLGTTYSDMNAWGPYLGPFVTFKAFWGAVAVLFALTTNLLWVRGGDTGLATRLALARERATVQVVASGVVAALVALGLGGKILYQTHVRHTYRTSWEDQERLADYERRFETYAAQPQPRITGMKLEVDLYPGTGDLGARGTVSAVNQHEAPISEVFLRLPEDREERAFSFDRESELIEDDVDLGIRRYRLAVPLAPGEALEIRYDWWFPEKGFGNGGVNTVVVDNGSFVHSPAVVPAFGYDPGPELSTDRVRKKHGLEPKERMADLDDPAARANHYISRDSDWIDFEAVVSTDPDQIALAPGYLQREWTEGGRRYFHYAMDAKILNFTSFLSARYTVVRDRWRDVAIEVYHHPGHEWNVDRMIAAVKASLEVYTREFSPYQHRQVRIVEFPRYATFAQSFPNTIPYSESIGFIARVGEDDVDYPFYVTAHEVAHQWWAHQVIGADCQGSTLMSETLSQYSALLVMEQELGEDQIHEFLEHELKQYLTGRSTERKKELPLLRVENQQYIHYNKGSLALWLLKDHLGADALNRALADYIAEVGFQGPPYTTSRDLIRHLRAVTPEDRQYLITDLFERITLYENRALEAKARKVGDGWEVTLTYEAKKLQADEKGEETEVPLADLVDVGVFDADGKRLYLEKHRVDSATGEVTVTVSEEPAKAGIDPWHKLIDRHLDDNEVDVEIEPTS